MPVFDVRGPDPDGDWFVVLIVGDEEIAISETFIAEVTAQNAANELNRSTLSAS